MFLIVSSHLPQEGQAQSCTAPAVFSHLYGRQHDRFRVLTSGGARSQSNDFVLMPEGQSIRLPVDMGVQPSQPGRAQNQIVCR